MALTNLVVKLFTIPELQQLLEAPGLTFSKPFGRKTISVYSKILRSNKGHQIKFFIIKVANGISGKVLYRRAITPTQVNVYDELGVRYESLE